MLSNPGGSVLAGNVVLFAKALTLFANNAAYGRLAVDQRRVLRDAAAAAVRHAVAQTEQRRSFASASSTDAGFCSQPRPNLRHSRRRRSRSIGCSTPIDRRGGSSGRFGRGRARCPPIRQCPSRRAAADATPGAVRRPSAGSIATRRHLPLGDHTRRCTQVLGTAAEPGRHLSLDRHRDPPQRHVAPGRPRRRPRHVHDPGQPPSVQLASGCLGAHLHVHPRRRWHLAFEAGAADGPRRSVRLGLQAVAADGSSRPRRPVSAESPHAGVSLSRADSRLRACRRAPRPGRRSTAAQHRRRRRRRCGR